MPRGFHVWRSKVTATISSRRRHYGFFFFKPPSRCKNPEPLRLCYGYVTVNGMRHKRGRRPADRQPPGTSAAMIPLGEDLFQCSGAEGVSPVNLNTHILRRREAGCQSCRHQRGPDGRRGREVPCCFSLAGGSDLSILSLSGLTMCFSVCHPKRNFELPDFLNSFSFHQKPPKKGAKTGG